MALKCKHCGRIIPSEGGALQHLDKMHREQYAAMLAEHFQRGGVSK